MSAAPELWWTGRFEERKRDLAISAAILLAREADWVHRRILRAEFIDNDQIRWSVAIDFALPRLPWLPEGRVFVPLGLPSKRRLLDLDLRDEQGRPVAVLTRAENSALATEILRQQAEQVLGPAAVDEDLIEKFEQITGQFTPALPERPKDRDKEVAEAVAYFRDLERRRPDEGADGAMYTLWRDPAMRSLLWTFACRFVLFAQVEQGNEPAPRRQILTMSYERRFFVASGERRLRAALAQGLGLAPYTVAIATRVFRNAQSYHVQIRPPQELYVVEAAIQRQVWEQPTRSWRPMPVASRAVRTNKAHLHVTAGSFRDHHGEQGEGWELMELTLSLYLRFGALWPTILSTCLLTVTLAVGLVLREGFDVHAGGDAAAILVAGLSLFTPWFVPGDHQLVRRMFRPLRLFLVVSTIAGFAAAAALAIELPTGLTVACWSAATGVSFVCSAILVIAGVRTWRNARVTGLAETRPAPEPSADAAPAASGRKEPPEALDALAEIAHQSKRFFHIVGDSGEGVSIPLAGERIEQRARAAG